MQSRDSTTANFYQRGAGRPVHPRATRAMDAKLRREGYDDTTIALARAQEAAGGRAGDQRTLREILDQKPQHRLREAKGPADLSVRELRRRGQRGNMALAVRLDARTEADPGVRDRLLSAAAILEAMPDRPRQLEFDFWTNGNWSTGHNFVRATAQKLKDFGASPSEHRNALAALMLILSYLGWETYICRRHAFELGAELQMTKSGLSRTLQLLENVNAIKRVKRGQVKVITVTPEGAYFGNIKRHGDAVRRYGMEVLGVDVPAAPVPAALAEMAGMPVPDHVFPAGASSG